MSELENFDNLSPEEFINQKVAGKSDAEVEVELKKLELELKKQELAAKQQQLEYMKFDLIVKKDEAGKIEGRRTAQIEINKQKMQSLLNFMAQRKAQQEICNHRKGGLDAQALIQGQGQSPLYCIIRHKLPNGGYMGICSRCGKEWMPAYKSHVDERGNVITVPASEGWAQMMTWPTDNTASTSTTFFFEKTNV